MEPPFDTTKPTKCSIRFNRRNKTITMKKTFRDVRYEMLSNLVAFLVITPLVMGLIKLIDLLIESIH